MQNISEAKVKKYSVASYGLGSAFIMLSGLVIGLWIVLGPRFNEIFTAKDTDHSIVYVGCGLSSQSKTLDDIWALDMNTYTWQKIETKGDSLSPRTGCVAAYYRGYIIIFGGFYKGMYCNDMYVLNTKTHELNKLNTNGDIPAPRSNPIFQIVNDHLYVWGGYNGEWPHDLSVLTLQTLEWRTYPQTMTPRTSLPSVVYNDNILAFGSSKNSGIICIDTKEKVVKSIPTCGSEPPSNVMNAGMIETNSLLFFYGGKSNTTYTLVYCCDIERKWWFVFHITPDGETTSVTDGRVSEIGLFMLPRIHSFSTFYNEKKREIVGCFGSPYADPPHLFTLQIGYALGVISMRNDMLDILSKTNQ